MTLRLIPGGANSNRDGLVLTELAGAAMRLQPALLLPTAADVRRAEQQLAEDRVQGVACSTFDNWIERAWVLYGDGRHFVGTAARAAILSDLAESADMSDVGISGRTAGFFDLASDLAKRAYSDIRPAQRGSARAIGALLQSYARRLEGNGLIEAARAASILAEAPPRLPGPIFVVGFSDFSVEQEQLLMALGEFNEVVISLMWEPAREATGAMTPLVERLRTAGAAVKNAGPGGWHEPVLAALEAGLFEGGGPLPAGESIVMCEAAGAEAECALAARMASEAIAAGAAPADVAIAFREMGARLPILAAALRAEGLSAVFDVSMAFGDTPFGSALEALVDAVALRGDTRERALVFLASPYSGLGSDVTARLDASWRGRRAQSSEILADMRRERGLKEILALAKTLVDAQVEAECAQNWQRLAGVLLKNADACRGERMVDAARDAAGHRAFLRAVSEVADVGGAGEVDLRRALRSVRVSVVQGDPGEGVLVTEAHRLRGLRFKTVILGGLTAGEFSPSSRDSLLASLCLTLGLAPMGDSAASERTLFHSLVGTATSKLVFLRTSVNERGEAIRPSVFWEEVLDLFRSAEESLEGAWPKGLRREKLSLADVAACAPSFLPGRERLRRELPLGAPVPPKRGTLSRQTIDELLGDRDEFSVSEVESYIACPYRWFHNSVLRPQEIDAAVDARERGSLAHAILSAFYCAWRADGRARILPEELDDALAGLDEAVARTLADADRVAQVTLSDRVSAAKAVGWARNIIHDDVDYLPGFVPEHHELAFGRLRERPVEVGGVNLKGCIDRIDVGPQGVFVTDYKSSSAVHGRASFEGKGSLQIPIYAHVAGKLTGRPVLGGVYRSLKSLAARGFWLDEEICLGRRGSDGDRCSAETLVDETDAAIERLKCAVEGMRAGEIAPRPLSKDSCEFCGARSFCGEVL